MTPSAKAPATNFQQALLTWYKATARPLPWRDYTPSPTLPYRVWLAEIMLQQTTVATVIPYYKRFLEAFPTVQALAAAPINDVLHLWQGLGYYRRAHLLHRCAQSIVNEHQGVFPSTEEGLRTLPGFGPYTTAAVASLAYEQPALAIDGNVVRVLSRLMALKEVATPTHKKLHSFGTQLTAGAPPRALTNALMELGSQVCAPKNPLCLTCPVRTFCAAAVEGNPTQYPYKLAKKTLPIHHGVAFVLHDGKGNLWLRQRPEKGLLGGLWEMPCTIAKLKTEASEASKIALTECGTFRHTFTHFHLEMEVRLGQVKTIPAAHRFALNNLPPLPTLMRKVLALAKIS